MSLNKLSTVSLIEIRSALIRNSATTSFNKSLDIALLIKDIEKELIKR